VYKLTKGQAGTLTLTNRVTRQPAGTIEAWGGWQWEHDGFRYKTNRQGEGLFVWCRRGDWSQIQGTGQFSLPIVRQEALRKLRRMGLGPDREEAPVGVAVGAHKPT
jgi:hypothetical protein